MKLVKQIFLNLIITSAMMELELKPHLKLIYKLNK